MARALLLLLLLLGIAVESLAQNATTNSSTGVSDMILANTTSSSSTGIDNSTGSNNSSDSSSTGVDAALTADSMWRKSSDWLINDYWGQFTIGATILAIILLCALASAYRHKTTKVKLRAKMAAAAKNEAQAATKGKVRDPRDGFSTVPSGAYGEEEEEEEDEEPIDFSSMKTIIATCS